MLFDTWFDNQSIDLKQHVGRKGKAKISIRDTREMICFRTPKKIERTKLSVKLNIFIEDIHHCTCSLCPISIEFPWDPGIFGTI